MRTTRTIAATAGIAGAVGLGALTIGSVLPVEALEDPTTDNAAGVVATHPGPGPGRGRILDDALDELVANETLTEEQADAVRAEVAERVEALPGEGRGPGPGPGRGHGPGHRVLHEAFETAAGAIGIEVAELRDAVEGGQSVAGVATANGVDPEAVIDALVAAGEAALDEAVAEDRLDEDRAAEIRENLEERARAFVERQPED